MIGTVSASDNLSAADVDSSISEIQDYAQIEVTDECVSDVEETVSISDCDIECVDFDSQTPPYSDGQISRYLSSGSHKQYSVDGIDSNVGEFISVSSQTLSFSDNENNLVSSYDELEGVSLDNIE